MFNYSFPKPLSVCFSYLFFYSKAAVTILLLPCFGCAKAEENYLTFFSRDNNCFSLLLILPRFLSETEASKCEVFFATGLIGQKALRGCFSMSII